MDKMICPTCDGTGFVNHDGYRGIRDCPDCGGSGVGGDGQPRGMDEMTAEWELLARTFHGPRPRIVCLCGSTRFGAAYQAANLRETLAGRIVLTVGCDTRSDADLAAAGELGQDLTATKAMLDELHLRKIDLADEVLVLNVDGYVGESTAQEIAYAREHGKPIRYLEPTA